MTAADTSSATSVSKSSSKTPSKSSPKSKAGSPARLELLPISFGVPPGYRLVIVAGRVSAEAEVMVADVAEVSDLRLRLSERLRLKASALLGSEAVADAGSAPSPVGALISTGFSFESSEDAHGVRLLGRAVALVAILSPSDDAPSEVSPVHTAVAALTQGAPQALEDVTAAARAAQESSGSEPTGGLYL